MKKSANKIYILLRIEKKNRIPYKLDPPQFNRNLPRIDATLTR